MLLGEWIIRIWEMKIDQTVGNQVMFGITIIILGLIIPWFFNTIKQSIIKLFKKLFAKWDEIPHIKQRKIVRKKRKTGKFSVADFKYLLEALDNGTLVNKKAIKLIEDEKKNWLIKSEVIKQQARNLDYNLSTNKDFRPSVVEKEKDEL